MTALYAALAVLGALVPLSAIVPWLAYNGLDWQLFVGELLAGRPARFVALGLLITAAVSTLLILDQGRRDRVPALWLPIFATLLLGVSCGLPLFLAMRAATMARR